MAGEPAAPPADAACAAAEPDTPQAEAPRGLLPCEKRSLALLALAWCGRPTPRAA